jgi:hypothetical protein
MPSARATRERSLCGGFGIGLIIAAIVKYVADGLDLYGTSWTVAAGVLIWVSRVILGMLETEK